MTRQGFSMRNWKAENCCVGLILLHHLAHENGIEARAADALGTALGLEHVFLDLPGILR